MPNTKGTDIVALRDIIHGQGTAREKEFIVTLTPELEKLYKTAAPITWSPVEIQTSLYEAAAKHLFPDQPNPMRELGKAMARKTFGGIYRIFLKIPRLEKVIGQTAHMWRTYYDQGDAAIEKFQDHSAEFVVRRFPELPLSLRDLIGGHLTVILEYTGAQRVRLSVNSDNAEAWVWLAQWD